MHKEENSRVRKMEWSPLSLAIGTAVSFGVCILFLMLASLGIWAGWIEEELMGQLTVASCVLGSFIGGIASVKHGPGNTILTGLAVGVIMFLLLYLIGSAIYGVTEIDKDGAILILGCLCGGALAGALCRRRPTKSSRAGERSRKRRKG